MLMSARRFLWILCFGVALFLTVPTAEAKGIMIINYGEDVFETGPLPASIAADLPGAKAGVSLQRLWGLLGLSCDVGLHPGGLRG